ncbi:MAG: helix-turn-helix transcriptional regulator [Erysipelotrichaceae bacterium]
MTFHEKLKNLRVKNEYSQEQLAELLNVSRQAITKWENGKGMPDINNIKAIAEIFDVTLDSLLNDVEEMESTDEYFCWKICFSMAIIGLVVGWLLMSIVGTTINMGAFGIGGGIIGYALGYIILEITSKLKK